MHSSVELRNVRAITELPIRNESQSSILLKWTECLLRSTPYKCCGFRQKVPAYGWTDGWIHHRTHLNRPTIVCMYSYIHKSAAMVESWIESCPSDM